MKTRLDDKEDKFKEEFEALTQEWQVERKVN